MEGTVTETEYGTIFSLLNSQWELQLFLHIACEPINYGIMSFLMLNSSEERKIHALK